MIEEREVERRTAYNAGEIREVELSVTGPVERQRLRQSAPAWVRSLVVDLVRRIANLRRECHELEEKLKKSVK